MTDREIVKALEDLVKCNNNEIDCDNCSLSVFYPRCPEEIGELSLDLINRLQARVDDLERNDLPRCKDALRRANEMGIKLQAENERLNKEVDRLSQVVLYNDGVTEMKVEEAKTEAYKECIEKVKEEINKHSYGVLHKIVINYKINNLLKELVGEDK